MTGIQCLRRCDFRISGHFRRLPTNAFLACDLVDITYRSITVRCDSTHRLNALHLIPTVRWLQARRRTLCTDCVGDVTDRSRLTPSVPLCYTVCLPTTFGMPHQQRTFWLRFLWSNITHSDRPATPGMKTHGELRLPVVQSRPSLCMV